MAADSGEVQAQLAIDGGEPIRIELLPYGRQTVDDDDVAAVVGVLRSDWLTTGPQVEAFEAAIAQVAGVAHGVAVSSGTAALHAAAFAIGIGPGDEVIVPAITFAASANCAVYLGARPVFADVDPETLLIDVEHAASLVNDRTRAVVAVDFAGQPCDYDALDALCERRGLTLIADACHAIGGSYHGRPVGSLAAASTFSFHPVKHIATGEGGMLVTDDAGIAERARAFRSHGIAADFRKREQLGSWFYEMVDLGYNYRMSDINCALGLSQLTKLRASVARRRGIAARYDAAFASLGGVSPLAVSHDVGHAFHLYVVRLPLDRWTVDRGTVYRALRAEGIGVNVHYLPVYLHPFYKARFGYGHGLCPNAESAYGTILSLPMFPGMSDSDVDDVIAAFGKVWRHFGRVGAG